MGETDEKVLEEIYALAMETASHIEDVTTKAEQTKDIGFVLGIIPVIIPKWKSLCLKLAGLTDEEFSKFIIVQVNKQYSDRQKCTKAGD